MKNQLEPPRYPIESVDNALRLVLLFQEQELVGVKEAARVLDVAPSTAHRLLAMLQYHGFVRHDASARGYVPGRALVDVGLSVVRDTDIRQSAQPFLEELRDELDETVHLVVLQDTYALFVDGIESSKPLRAGVIAGRMMPAHQAASGKALLADLPLARLRELYPSARMPSVNGAPSREREDFEAELETIRRVGYAISRGTAPEELSDLCAVAAAVRGHAGAARAAVVVTAPATRADEEWVTRAANALMRTGSAIGESIV